MAPWSGSLRWRSWLPLAAALAALGVVGAGVAGEPERPWLKFEITAASQPDPEWQRSVEAIDAALRAKWKLPAEARAVGVLDLRTSRLAWLRPDATTYAASIPKIGILLAWAEAHPERLRRLDPATRRELGEMIKRSSNELAPKFSRELGMARVQAVLNAHGFYDAARGGGIWFGKHYGKDSERVRDPVGDHSHAANVRQLLRFYLLLEQGRLLSAEASAAMRDLFAAPELPHIEDRFVKGLAGRGLEIRRKSGWWEKWSHDSAAVSGAGRHYLLVVLTEHPGGTEYLEEFAARIDDALGGAAVAR